MELDLRVVRSFAALAATLSFTKAAAFMQVTQPQLSARIRSLELQLGFRLFDRTSRRVSLTAQGEALLPRARRLLEEADSFVGEAHDIQFNITSTLRIGAEDYFQPLRRRLLGEYMRRHPDELVEVEPIRDPTGSGSLQGLLASRFDVAFLSWLEADPLPPEFEGLVIARQPLGLLLPAGSDLGAAAQVEPGDLAGVSVAVFRRELSPVLHDQVVGAISPFGAKILRLPEPSEAGLLDFVRVTGQPAACALWWTAPEDQPQGVVHRPIRGLEFHFLSMLVRLRSRASPAGERIWRLAQRAIAAQEPEAA